MMPDLGIVDVERGDYGDTAFLMRCGCIVHLDTAFDGVGLSFGPLCPRVPHACPPPGPESVDRIALARQHRIAGFCRELFGPTAVRTWSEKIEAFALRGEPPFEGDR